MPNVSERCKLRSNLLLIIKATYNVVNFSLVPNVSFRVYAPGFLDRFLESHAVMLQGNSDLKVKEGEVSSRPWQWPINYRVNY